MADASQDEAAFLAEYRRSRGSAGPQVAPQGGADEAAFLNEYRNQKAAGSFLASKSGEDFQSARDNPDEVPPGVRAIASLPISAAGKLGYLQSRYPEGVKSAPGGKVIVREAGKWKELNKPGLDWGDVAGMLGPAIEAVPTVVAGAATSEASPLVSIPVAGAASALGNVARQGIAKAVTGEKIPGRPQSAEPELDLLRKDNLGERAKQVLTSGVLGALGEAGLRGVAGVLDWIRPTSQMSRIAQGGEQSATKEGLALRDQFKAPMSAADVTQNPDLMAKEAIMRRTGGGAGEVIRKADEARAVFLRDKSYQIADEVAAGMSTNAGDAGKAIANMAKDAQKSRRAIMMDHAAENFGAIDKATNGRPVMRPDEYRNVLIDELKKAKNPGAKDAKIIADVQSRLDDLNEAHGLLTGQQFTEAMHYWGERMGEPNLGEMSTTQRIAKRVFKAYSQDLQNAVDNASAGGMAGPKAEVSDAIRNARDTYRIDYGKVDEVGEDAILQRAGVLDERHSPDTFIKEYASGRKSNVQLGQALKVADAVDPATANQLRGALLREKFTPTTGDVDSPVTMLGKLDRRENKELIDTLFENQPAMRGKLEEFKSLVKRQANTLKTLAGSPTDPRAQARDALKKGAEYVAEPMAGIGAAVLGGAVAGGAGAAGAGIMVGAKLLKQVQGALMSSAGMAKVVTSPEGVNLLLGLMKPPRSAPKEATKLAVRSLNRILEIAGTETFPEVNNP